MSSFNQNKRSSNVIKSASVGMFTNVAKILMAFCYRTLFVHVLSAEYLGINGLFSNILQILSLAELGVTTAIIYRFYEPINQGDVAKVGRLMNFFRRIYHLIAAVILVAGLLLTPFLPHLINAEDSVPPDINLYVVYILFLINTVSSYLFAYKLLLLNADQKNYLFSMIDTIIAFIRYLAQAIVLIVFVNYTLSLAIGIFTTLLFNWLFSEWVTRQYSDVFANKDQLEKEEKSKIFEDTRACMYHKVGTVVLTGTDSAVITKMVSLASAGIYSNYSLIILNLQSLMGQLLGNFVSSLGDARLDLSSEDYYSLYRKMNFFGLWVTGFTTACLYVAIDDFIEVWLGTAYVFNTAATIALCIQYYLLVSSNISMAFTNASGLFVKDKIRPLIEATINLVVSIVMARYWGITGVFIGTIVSILLTNFWRIPLVIYRYDFKRPMTDYWKDYALFFGYTLLFCLAVSVTKDRLMLSHSWLVLFAEVLVAALCFNLILMLICRRRTEYIFVKETALSIVSRLMKR